MVEAATSTRELIEHMGKFMERDIGFFSYMETLDLKSSMGRAMFTIISAFAQLERDIIRERTMAGLERARAQGKKLGRPLQSGKVYRRPALMDVAKLHFQGQSIREIPTNSRGCLFKRGILQSMCCLSESGVFQTKELTSNAQIFHGQMV